MSAFKESGSLEYSADVLLALQPEGMVEGEDNKAKKNNIETVKKCKAATERNVELVILKNRNGSTNKTLNFNYYAMFNCFEEAQRKDYSQDYTEVKHPVAVW
jgi:replicative DNA helicase